MTDVELLEQHRGGSQSAFTDLVRRHMGWVYAMARRRLRDAHLAEDVAQAVFILLHRKSPRFSADGAMINWLHKAAWYATQTAARGERNRRRRETAAAMIQSQSTEPSDGPDQPRWQELAPLLDELIGQLKQADRELILLRYFRDMTFAEVAAEAGTTPEAVRKRVERAIDQLRRLAEGKGISLSSITLAANLMSNVRIPPPPGLTATASVAATAHAGSTLSASSSAIVKGATSMMASTKITLFAGAAVVLLALGVVVAGVVKWSGAPLTDLVMDAAPDAAPPAPAARDEIQQAIGKLAAVGNYSWTVKCQGPDITRVGWGGEIQKDGLTSVSLGNVGPTFQTLIRKNKLLVNTFLGWKTQAETNQSLPLRLAKANTVGMYTSGFILPADDAKDILGKADKISRADDMLMGDLSSAAVHELMAGHFIDGKVPFRIISTKPAGSAKFWIRDGVLWKYAYRFAVERKTIITETATAQLFGEIPAQHFDETVIVEINDVGTTKIDVPDAVLSKLNQ